MGWRERTLQPKKKKKNPQIIEKKKSDDSKSINNNNNNKSLKSFQFVITKETENCYSWRPERQTRSET